MGMRGRRHGKLFTAALMAVMGLGVVALGVSSTRAADEDSPIAVAMKKAFKGAGKPKPGAAAPAGEKKPSLVSKAIDGKATDEELKSLLGYVQDMSKAKPPKGDQADWDSRCGKIVAAVEALSKGDKSAGADLKAAASCKDCHSKHKED